MRLTANDAVWLNEFLAQQWVLDAYADNSVSDSTRIIQGDILLSTPNVYVLSNRKGSLQVFEPFARTFIYHAHVLIEPELRGETGIQDGVDAVFWMFNNTDCRKIIGMPPVTNTAACKYATLIGMKKEGILEKSYLKNGILIDRNVYGISKE